MKKSTLTNIAAVLADVLFIGVTLFLFKYHSGLDTGMEIINLNNSEAKRIATTLFFSKLESVGKISLALLGVLWAFIIYTGNRINIRTMSQINLFIVTNLCLLFSFGSYFWGYDFLLSRIFYHSTIDLEAPIVKFYSIAQLVYFISGIFWFVITILLCHEKNLLQRR
ncbi:MAG: hypothetical protein A4E64_01753 [Syntrophorhabdus sp. PtaU1.Bin058]|nr:MAG: hypothetical protein A4E64_01753 [Syntrophorhabdus sp. PtaU1.Bin058]